MARPKKSKQKRTPDSAAATLDEIESLGDKLVAWVTDNPAVVLGSLLAVLVIGGGWGFVASRQETSREAAAAALASVQSEYRTAMGGSPEDLQIPEPANPETALRVRREYALRFASVASDFEGTAAGALAAMEHGSLELDLGDGEQALAVWRATVDGLPANHPVRALILLRIAGHHETEDRWLEAADAYTEAAAVDGYPLRYGALADAARCYAEADAVEQALAAFARIESEAPELLLPEHVGARLRELRARSYDQ